MAQPVGRKAASAENRSGSSRVLDPVLVAIGQRTPFDAHNGGVAQVLRDPFPVAKVLFQRLRFHEQARGAVQKKPVVDWIILGLAAEFSADLVDVLEVPPERV